MAGICEKVDVKRMTKEVQSGEVKGRSGKGESESELDG